MQRTIPGKGRGRVKNLEKHLDVIDARSPLPLTRITTVEHWDRQMGFRNDESGMQKPMVQAHEAQSSLDEQKRCLDHLFAI